MLGVAFCAEGVIKYKNECTLVKREGLRVEVSAMLLYMVTTMITPGPNNLAMMYLSVQHGFRGTLRFFAGSACAGEEIYREPRRSAERIFFAP
jgi:hypothetical protein